MPALPLLSSSSGCKTVGRSGEKKESGGNKVFEEKGGRGKKCREGMVRVLVCESCPNC